MPRPNRTRTPGAPAVARASASAQPEVRAGGQHLLRWRRGLERHSHKLPDHIIGYAHCEFGSGSDLCDWLLGQQPLEKQ
jgi:hypothetical protein